ncbi:MAG: response regulator [Planctomycetaceae bacterium]|nr:response regulator [Planctomycetaceae bacterium]
MINIRVLIADSNWKLMGRYEMFLNGCGLEVATADTALLCVEMLRGFEPDILVLEAELPWGQGDGVLDLMQTEPDVPVCPVIMLSDLPEWEGLHQFGAIEVAEYHQKPLSPMELREAVMRVYHEGVSAWRTALSIHG